MILTNQIVDEVWNNAFFFSAFEVQLRHLKCPWQSSGPPWSRPSETQRKGAPLLMLLIMWPTGMFSNTPANSRFPSWTTKHKSWQRIWHKVIRSLCQSKICKESIFSAHGHLPTLLRWGWTETSDHIFQLYGAEVVNRWYRESSYHDYHSETPNTRSGKSPRKSKTLSNSSGNFSQLIWRASKTLGVGYGRFVSTRPWPEGLDEIVAQIQLHTPRLASAALGWNWWNCARTF